MMIAKEIAKAKKKKMTTMWKKRKMKRHEGEDDDEDEEGDRRVSDGVDSSWPMVDAFDEETLGSSVKVYSFESP
ncbi:unnamed protein product [Heligmosomoides polygyrus]|uniref:Uncharacterized protein n=1 Tax=Heligmosomoides polygyrus TaxID=6339 RepID=A0A3P7TES4_HELPZ|nr:unnamed protein product [Heligmosomoides polygyrus]